MRALDAPGVHADFRRNSSLFGMWGFAVKGNGILHELW